MVPSSQSTYLQRHSYAIQHSTLIPDAIWKPCLIADKEANGLPLPALFNLTKLENMKHPRLIVLDLPQECSLVVLGSISHGSSSHVFVLHTSS